MSSFSSVHLNKLQSWFNYWANRVFAGRC